MITAMPLAGFSVAVGLSPYRRDFPILTLGWIETGAGLVTVLIIAVGYWML